LAGIVDWAAPILAEPLRIDAGMAIVPERPGTGLVWDDEAVRRFRVV
jgi:mandelate racemase